ncbi:MAG: hypothetical protein AB7R55_10705 [Gemmatimonadales bacterium]
MSDERPAPSPHPYGADAPTEDHVGLAFGALPAAVALGTGIISLSTILVRTIQASQPPAQSIELSSGPSIALLGGTFVALTAAAVLTWRLLAPTRSPYRQGMLAMVAAFGTLLVSLLTMPIDRAFGRPGLAGLALVSLVASWRLIRRVRAG